MPTKRSTKPSPSTFANPDITVYRLFPLHGTMLPFAATEAERGTDPRASLAARYPEATYADAVRAVTQALLRDRLLLPEDAERYLRAT